MQTKQDAYNTAKKADRVVARLEFRVFRATTQQGKKAAWQAVHSARNEAYRLWTIYDSIPYEQ